MLAKNFETSALEALKTLRRNKLSRGLPFMINSDMLDSKQCFLEYPDGSIKVAEADPDECDFRIILEYNIQDSKKLRKRLNIL